MALFSYAKVAKPFFSLVCAGMMLAALGAERTWTGADIANDPSWSNGGNWEDGAPAAGDTASFPNDAGDIVVSASDIPLFQSLPIITGGNATTTTRLLFQPTGDVVLTNKIAYVRFVKQGSGTTSLKGGDGKAYSSCNFTVESGALGLQTEPSQDSNYYEYGHIAVSNGATLYLPYDGDSSCSASVQSLNNEGTIAPYNASSVGLRIVGNDTPSVIGGTMQGQINFMPNSTNVYLAGTAHTFTGGLKPYTANEKVDKTQVAIDHVGMTTDASSSCGKVASLNFLYNGARYLYKGTGETTDRAIDWCLDWYNYNPYHEPEFDAGSVGGVTFTGKWYVNAVSPARRAAELTTFVLSGDNAKPCTVSCEMSSSSSSKTDYSVYITKRGTGTWRFNDHEARKNTGVIAVEDGVLQFESIAEKGEVCSLGLATQLYKKHYGNRDDAETADYAFLLGTTNAMGEVATEGVMEHVGISNAFSSTRPIALLGDGRLVASGGALVIPTVSAAAAGERTIKLDGSNAVWNAVSGVSDGAGTVSVVKVGTNEWRLCGTLDFSGDLAVNSGTLSVSGTGLPYRFFRFNSYENTLTRFNVNDGYRYQHTMDEFSLFDANGVRQNVGFSFPDDNMSKACDAYVDGIAINLPPGEMCPGRAGMWHFRANGQYGLAKLTDTNVKNAVLALNGYYQDANSKNTSPTIDHPERRVSFVTHVTNGTPEIVRYDFCSSSSVSNAPSTFSLEGSVDGVAWTLLHAVTNQPPVSGGWRWVSDDTEFSKQYTSAGFSVSGHSTAPSPLANVRSVSVAAGATLRAIGTVAPIRGLTVDAAGAGTIDGFSFSSDAGCTLNVRNAGRFDFLALPGTYTNVTGLANIANWAVAVDGVAKPSLSAVVKNGAIAIFRKGLLLIVK